MEKVTIIIADDNRAWVNLLNKYLTNYEEIKVLGITDDGEQQIKMIKDLKPDIVITDLKRNKGISGIEVIEQCYKLNIKTKFLVTTAGYYNYKFEELEKMGIRHFLYKPFNLNDVIKEIKNIQSEKTTELVVMQKFINDRKMTIMNLIIEKFKQLAIILRKG